MNKEEAEKAIFQRWLNAQLRQVFLAEVRPPTEET